jgi:hypothetical protein
MHPEKNAVAFESSVNRLEIARHYIALFEDEVTKIEGPHHIDGRGTHLQHIGLEQRHTLPLFRGKTTYAVRLTPLKNFCIDIHANGRVVQTFPNPLAGSARGPAKVLAKTLCRPVSDIAECIRHKRAFLLDILHRRLVQLVEVGEIRHRRCAAPPGAPADVLFSCRHSAGRIL